MDIIAKLIQSISEIPLLSNSASLLLNILSKERHSLSDLSAVVEQDNILTAKILKIVNSAAFSLTYEITSVEKAIPFLGEKLLQSIAIESSASRVFGRPLEGYASKQGELWSHSLKTAIASKHIADFSKNRIEPGTAFTCGIMHDIGKSVLSNFMILNNGVETISTSLTNNPEQSYLDLELNRVGANHCQAGYLLGKHWKLPDVFNNVILYHHAPSQAPQEFRTYCFCVHLADMVSMLTGTGTGLDSLRYELDQKFTDYIDFPEFEMYKALLFVEEEFQKIKSQLFPNQES